VQQGVNIVGTHAQVNESLGRNSDLTVGFLDRLLQTTAQIAALHFLPDTTCGRFPTDSKIVPDNPKTRENVPVLTKFVPTSKLGANWASG
jgi:hypothetical protein